MCDRIVRATPIDRRDRERSTWTRSAAFRRFRMMPSRATRAKPRAPYHRDVTRRRQCAGSLS